MGRQKGSITVFLSLTGILIVALLGTLLETARFTACADHAARTTRMAADTLMTEYHRPLYDNYGLFFIESKGIPFETVIAKYSGDTLEAASGRSMDFFQGELRGVEIKDKVFVGDHKAEPLQKEIESFMLRRLTQKQLKKFTDQSEEAVSTNTTAEQIEASVEEQRKEVKLDSRWVELIGLIDGIHISGGKITCANEFVKMFVTGEKKSQNFGITNANVWKKMKKKLDDTPREFKHINKNTFKKRIQNVLKLTETAIKKVDQLRSDYQKIGYDEAEFSNRSSKITSLENMSSALKTNERILKKTAEILGQKLTKEKKETLSGLWKDYTTSQPVFDYTGVGEQESAQDPRESLKASWKDGILNLVCEDVSKLAKGEVKNEDSFAQQNNAQDQEKGGYTEKSKSLVKEETVELSGAIKDVSGCAMGDFCLNSYIMDQLPGYGEVIREWKPSLTYQWEYVLAGKKTDRENLEAVLNRILLIRSAVNFAAIYQDEAKKTEAYMTAAALVGFTGMDALIRLTQTMILITWSVVEGLVDVAGLLNHRHVPLTKKPGEILTKYTEIFQITSAAITKRAGRYPKETKTSFGYREYVMVFLALTKKETKRYRIMDLIQWDMKKNGYESFDLGMCVYSICVSADYVFPSKFFHFPSIQQMLQRKIREYPYHTEILRHYA